MEINKKYFIPIILFLTFMAVVYITYPAFGDYQKLSAELEEKQEALKEKEQFLERLEKYNREMGEYEKEISNVKTALPAEPSFSSMLSFLEKTAKRTGVSLNSFNEMSRGSEEAKQKEENQADNSKNKAEPVVYSLDLEGPLFALENFLKEVESSSRIIEVGTISTRKELQGDALQINISIKSFYY